MKIAVMGAGAVGCYYGAMLARAGHDVTLIEVMPLGEVDGERIDHYLPLDAVRSELENRWTLTPRAVKSSPAL